MRSLAEHSAAYRWRDKCEWPPSNWRNDGFPTCRGFHGSRGREWGNAGARMPETVELFFFFSFIFLFFFSFFFFFFFFSLIYPVTKHPCKRGGSRGTLIRENHCAASFGRVNCVKIYMRMGRETEVRIVGRKNGKIGIKCFIVYYLCTYGGYCLVWLFVKVCEANLWMERKKKKKKKEKRRKRYAWVHIIWKFLFVAVKL